MVAKDAIFQNISQESVHDPIQQLGESIEHSDEKLRKISSDFEVVDVS
jgi:hypothetical protein